MSDIQIFDKTIGLLQKTLDLRLQNQQAIASNIANVDTPGYSPVRLEFEEKLRQAVKSTAKAQEPAHPAHFPLTGGSVSSIQPEVIQVRNKSNLGDRNGVSIDREMVSLSENQILYEATIQLLNKKLGFLKYVAEESR
jgi:flagellar basal-body rod protein FlgB